SGCDDSIYEEFETEMRFGSTKPGNLLSTLFSKICDHKYLILASAFGFLCAAGAIYGGYKIYKKITKKEEKDEEKDESKPLETD
nr:3A [hepatovirus B1]